MKPVFCIGDICADLTIPYGAVTRVKRGIPVPAEETDVGFFHGGSGANTASGLCKLGLPVIFCGTSGEDAYGHALHDELLRLGASMSCFRFDASVPTLLIAIVIDESGERTAFATQHTKASQHQILPSQIPSDLEKQIGWLHCSGVLLREDPAASVMLEAMKRCHEAGIPVSLDIMARIESMNDPVYLSNLSTAYSYSTVLLGSITDEIPLLSGGTDDASITRLASGGRIIAAHAGKKGAFVYTETETDFCPAFSVPVADTIGAGDSYNAGFLYGLMHQMPLHEANRFANAAAACCVRRAGGRSCPDLPELNAFLAENLPEEN